MMATGEREDWHDAGESAYWAFEQLRDATTIGEQGDAFTTLSNAMADLVTWLPGWDGDRGVLVAPDEPRERDIDRK